MNSLPAGATVLVAASADDVPAAVLALEERGLKVGKRVSSQVAAVVCIPRRTALSGTPAQQADKYESKGIRILDFEEVPVSSSSHMESSRASSSPRASAVATLSQASSPRKRSAPAQASGTAADERRYAPWRKSCSSATLERIERAQGQRMYLIKQEPTESCTDGGPARRFVVLGTTGNAYTVMLDSIVSCDCPDAARGNVCKHQLFVFLRVLRLPPSSPLIYQRALLSSERAKIFATRRRPEQRALASASVQEAFAEATGTSSASSAKDTGKEQSAADHRGSEDDDCPICFEVLGKEKLQVCKACSNALHEDCFRQWARQKRGDITCPFCRTEWVTDAPKASGGCSHVAGYLNFRAVAQ